MTFYTHVLQEMYLPVDVLLDEPPPPVASVVVEENNPPSGNNLLDSSQHHHHPHHPLAMVNYQQQHQQQHPQDNQAPSSASSTADRDRFQIHHQHQHQSYFVQNFQPHLHQPQRPFSAAALAPTLHHHQLHDHDHHHHPHGDLDAAGEHIFHHQQSCGGDFDGDPDKKHHPQLALTPCADCQRTITDRFYLLVAERCWHVECLRCCICKVKLESHLTCFSREGQIYCKDDYYQRFCKRCVRCNRILSPKELVMRAKEFIFHMHCFNCVVCSTPLQPGDYFALAPSGLLYCQLHYEPLFYGSGTVPVPPPVASPTGSDLDLPPGVGAARFATGSSASPNKNNSIGGDCSDSQSIGGGGNGGKQAVGKSQKGRPKKRKSVGLDDCLGPPQSEMTIHSHHQTAITMLGGGSSGPAGMLMSSRPQQQQPGMIQANRSSSPSSGGIGCSSSSLQHQQSRSKRMRTSFKHHQLRTMKAYFTLNHNPDAKDLKQLAQKTGLTKRVLQVWFQNARAKYRRSQQGKSQDPSNPSKSSPSGPTNTSGGGSDDIGGPTTDHEEGDQSIDELGDLINDDDAVHARRSSESSNDGGGISSSDDYSHPSGGGDGTMTGAPRRSTFVDDPYGSSNAVVKLHPLHSRTSPLASVQSELSSVQSDHHPHFVQGGGEVQRFRGDHSGEDDSASRSLADYFQCQSGLL